MVWRTEIDNQEKVNQINWIITNLASLITIK
jgi:hypothetical protein